MCARTRYDGLHTVIDHQSDAASVLLVRDERDVPGWVSRDPDSWSWNGYAIFGEDDYYAGPHCETTMRERLACIDELVKHGKARFMHVSGKITVDKIVSRTLSARYEECRL